MRAAAGLIVLLTACPAQPPASPVRRSKPADEPAAELDSKPQPTRPIDKPVSATAATVDDLELATQAFSDDAKKSFPGARDRFVAGLPKGHRFFLTMRLTDAQGRFEQLYVAVARVEDGQVFGRVASELSPGSLGAAAGYTRGDEISFPERDIVDWVITKPDGSEEGKLVGRFLDDYEPGKVFGARFGITLAESGPPAVRFVELVDHRNPKQPPTFEAPSVFRVAAEKQLREADWSGQTPGTEFFTYLIFVPTDPTKLDKGVGEPTP